MVFTCFFLNLFLGVLTASFEKSSGAALMTLGEKQWNAAQRMMVRLRSALYNWPAKIEHWPAGFQSSNTYLKTRPYFVLPRFTSKKPVGIGPMLNLGRPIVKCTPNV